MQSRASGSSSTIRARTVAVAGGSATLGANSDISTLYSGVEWQQYPGADAATRDIGDFQRRRLRSVQLGQPRPRVRQPDAVARRSPVERDEPVSAVADRELDVQSRATR